MPSPSTRGVHHLALNTEDMKATLDFYANVGGMPLVAFAVTPAQFAALQKRLRRAGVAVDGPLDVLPGLVSVYFFDPNGIRLEACCQPAAKAKPRVIASVRQSAAAMRKEVVTLPTKGKGAT